MRNSVSELGNLKYLLGNCILSLEFRDKGKSYCEADRGK
jgi:hypothetical protein